MSDRSAPNDEPDTRPSAVPFRDAVRVWAKIGLESFGGPAGQIAVMHRRLVDERAWIDEPRFLHALNYCMLLPGPEAQQLATYIGWLLHGWRGGVVAGLLFVLPGFVSILALSLLYAGFREVPAVAALFFGLKAAVLAVVVAAFLRIGQRVLHRRPLGVIAALAFASIFFFGVPFPWIVGLALAVGVLFGRVRAEWFRPVASGHGPAGAGASADAASGPAARPSLRRALGVVALWGGLWLLPIAALWWWLGTDHVFTTEAVFFSKAAVVTFGGAYAVLAYLAQAAVETYGWLQPGEMLDGLGMAETTPGPLIMVVQFVGFMGAFRAPGELDPYLAGVLASLLTTWVTFAPCFLWIFLGAPYVEALRGNQRLAAMLTAVTAAVVGVVLNLSVWFLLHTLFGELEEVRALGARILVPRWGTFEPVVAVLAVLAFVAMQRGRVGMIPALIGTATLGLLYRVLLG